MKYLFVFNSKALRYKYIAIIRIPRWLSIPKSRINTRTNKIINNNIFRLILFAFKFILSVDLNVIIVIKKTIIK